MELREILRLSKNKAEGWRPDGGADERELSDAEKEYKSKRKLVQKKLIKFATRIPAFMYLTDFRENTLQDVITKLEPDLFLAVTGLTVNDFDLLVRLKVFNTEQMNQAVVAFRRYEDASLWYTGIESQEGLSHYGLFMLKFPGAWRFKPPADNDWVNKSIPDSAVREFREVIDKTATQGSRQDILEHFKGYFCAVVGQPHVWSSNESWADTDLWTYMTSAAKNAPLFLEAFHDACESLRADDLFAPDTSMINEVCDQHRIGR